MNMIGRRTLTTSSSKTRSDAVLVSVDWLMNQIIKRKDRNDIEIVDATWDLPGSPFCGEESPRRRFDKCRIPGSTFVDIDEIGDRAFTTPEVAHNLPSDSNFIASLGIEKKSRVVVYDQHGIFSAPRFWYTLKAFGHLDVVVLNGGLPAWKRRGYDTENDASSSTHVTASKSNESYAKTLKKQTSLQWGIELVKKNIADQNFQHIDVRPEKRFYGEVPEPRPGMRGGRVPKSFNVPFMNLIDAKTSTMLPAETLRERFEDAGIDTTRPAVFSCGSGLTACIGALALNISHPDAGVAPIYDGSWSEWGGRSDTPIDVGRPAGES